VKQWEELQIQANKERRSPMLKISFVKGSKKLELVVISAEFVSDVNFP